MAQQILSNTVKQILTPEEAAELLGVAECTLTKWRQSGRHKLPYIKSGKIIRYRLKDLEEWLERHIVGTA